MAAKVGSQSWCATISFEIEPGLMCPGQRIMAGTRYAPSQLVFFSLRNGVMPPSGQVFMCGPLSVLYTNTVSFAMPRSSNALRTVPTFLS
jgi:hypothetical protein